jgi:anti-sigma regulatory factor (Ser/Thr protein kinase)
LKVSYELKCTTRPSSVAVVHDFIDRYLACFDPDKDWLPDVHVIADELASNIEKYAYGTDTGPYLVRISLENGCLEIDFEDMGKEFDPTRIKEVPFDGHHDRPAGKLGILLVLRLADRVRYARRGGQNVTSVALRIPRKKHPQNGDE